MTSATATLTEEDETFDLEELAFDVPPDIEAEAAAQTQAAAISVRGLRKSYGAL